VDNPTSAKPHLTKSNSCPTKRDHLYLIEPGLSQGEHPLPDLSVRYFRQFFPRPIIAAAGYTFERANAVLKEETADLVAFGQLFIANPDLVERFRKGAPFNEPDRSTFYGGGTKGYIDYPTLDQMQSAPKQAEQRQQ
jgi:N-ethylmaleimide reductase